jgi:hypothetical protein
MLDSKSQTSALKPLTFNPTDFTLTHTYYTLHPTHVRPKPFTLHPTPYTLTPYTLHPEAYIWVQIWSKHSTLLMFACVKVYTLNPEP